MDDKGVLRAALELYRARHYSGVVAVCTDALADSPRDLNLRLLLSRALLALRRDEEAQHQLQRCLQLEPRCAEAYRLLGELSLRRDEFRSAEIFCREALRIDPGEQRARELLDVLAKWTQPTAAVEKLPAATVAVGPFRSRRLAAGTEFDGDPDAERFGAYLLKIGAVTPSQLQAALAYHRRSRVRLGTAIAALGFATKPTIEWAAQAYHARSRSR